MARRSHRSAFIWMAGLSLVTLLLGAARELLIARELRASGAADLFFRGLVVVGAARSVALSLYRARWIPAPAGAAGRQLLRQELRVTLAMILSAQAALLVIVGGSAWTDPTLLVFALCVALGILGSALRALAERAGHERRAFMLEWALPLGVLVGAGLAPSGALGPSLGLMFGLLLGVLGVWPARSTATLNGPKDISSAPPGGLAALLLDALFYANLGLLDAALSHLFVVGGFARLNYAYLFVNAAIMVPAAAATVIALRVSADHPARAHAELRRWAILGGCIGGALVAALGLSFSWAPLAALLDRWVGWDVAEQTGMLILWSTPFAALRLLNTIGRQSQVAHDPRVLVPWDLSGLLARGLVLGLGAASLGVFASPLGLALAEALQIGAWWRGPRQRRAA